MKTTTESPAPLFFVFLISACGLAYELLLLRLFSQIQWHHLAYLAISLALLGHGASGAWLALVQHRWLSRVEFWLRINGLAFAVTAPGSFLLIQQLPFNSLELLWNPRQWLWLALLYLCLFFPFFFASNCLVLTLSYYRQAIGSLYAANLLGAGAGALILVLLQFYWSPINLLLGLSLLICFAVILLMLHQQNTARAWLSSILCIAFILGLPSELNPSPFKALSKQLLIPQSQIIHQQPSPYGTLQVLESGQFPLRIATGISMLNPYKLPTQYGLYVDGDGPLPINHWQSHQALQALAYLDQQTDALAYQLLATTEARVLLVGLDGGQELQQASWYKIKHTDIVEPNIQLINLMTRQLPSIWGWPRLSINSKIHQGDARAFVEQHPDTYDLIQLPLTGSGQGLETNYLLTRQGLSSLWQALSPQGILSITTALNIPPRTSMKLLVSLSKLLSSQVTREEQHLLLVRNWNTITLLVSKSSFTHQQRQIAQKFSQSRAFDLLMPANNLLANGRFAGGLEVPQPVYHQLPQEYFSQALSQLLSQPENFIQQYKFSIDAASDDKPYFFHFLRWQFLPEFYALFPQGGGGLIDQSYPMLCAVLILSVLLSLGLIILPLIWLKRSKPLPQVQHSALPWMSYFVLLGLGFMLVEMALMPSFIRFLSQPMISAVVVIAALLVFAGAGSQLSSKFRMESARYKVAISLVLLLFAYNFLLPWVFSLAGSWLLPLKLLCSLLLLLPLGLLMGMPFPLGLDSLSRQQGSWLPWAWGVNGCASVVSTSLGTLLSLHWGHSTVLLIGAGCYGLVAILPLGKNHSGG